MSIMLKCIIMWSTPRDWCTGTKFDCHLPKIRAEVCSNTTLWKKDGNYSCDYSKNYPLSKGFRCNGKIQQCIHPWYTFQNLGFSNDPRRPTTCEDKSDRIFPIDIKDRIPKIIKLKF